VPLVGVGSLGLGGIQALGGLGIVLGGAQIPGGAGRTFLLLGLAWLLPGLLLAGSGVAIVAGWSRAKAATVAAVAAGILALLLVAAGRAAIPGALADGIRYAADHPEAGKELKAVTERFRKEAGDDPDRMLRDPALAPVYAWTFTGYCACPVLPWYAVLMVASLLYPGKREP
jgi:hypothetical protein